MYTAFLYLARVFCFRLRLLTWCSALDLKPRNPKHTICLSPFLRLSQFWVKSLPEYGHYIKKKQKRCHANNFLKCNFVLNRAAQKWFVSVSVSVCSALCSQYGRQMEADLSFRPCSDLPLYESASVCRTVTGKSLLRERPLRSEHAYSNARKDWLVN